MEPIKLDKDVYSKSEVEQYIKKSFVSGYLRAVEVVMNHESKVLEELNNEIKNAKDKCVDNFLRHQRTIMDSMMEGLHDSTPD